MKKLKKSKKYVTVTGIEISLPKSEEDFVWVEYDFEDLRKVNVQSFPRQVVMAVNSDDGFGTDLFHEIEVYGGKEGVFIEFRCNFYNKFWEGFFGLTTYIKSIYDQIMSQNDFKVVDLDTSDVFKELNIDRHVKADGSVYDAVLDTAANLKELIKEAEASLYDKCRDYSLKELRENSI